MIISERNELRKNQRIRLAAVAAGLVLGYVSDVKAGTEYASPTAALFSADNCNLPIDCEIQKALLSRNGAY